MVAGGISEIDVPFVFVPHGDPRPVEWMARHPGWVRIPATFVPHKAAPSAMTIVAWDEAPSGPAPDIVVGRPAADGAPVMKRQGGPIRTRVPPHNPVGFGPGLTEDPIAAYLRVSAEIDRAAAERAPPPTPSPDPGRDAVYESGIGDLLIALGAGLGLVAGEAAAAMAGAARLLRRTALDALPLPTTPPPPRTTLDIVAPNGQPVGAVVGRARSWIRTVSPGEFQAIKEELMQGATPVAKPRYEGTWYIRQDGSSFGLRVSEENGLTIDINDPGLDQSFRIHQQ